jgi:CheY-like chemotaxis protein/two-component sensor histidine kinase
MAEELISAKEQAEDSSRAKTAFLSSMSHEMRTPLNAIIGMTSIGKSAPNLERKDYALGKIADASTQLLGIVNDVLDLAKIEADKMELSPVKFDLDLLIQRVVNVIGFRVEEKELNFFVSIDKTIPRKLIGDDNHLAQIVLNLLSNAVKFTPENGSVRLEACLASEEDGLCTLQFTVSDSGIGISREQQGLLFNAFQQANPSISRKFGGTGLGLVISKRLVEMMSGGIRIESELGKGAVFIFTVKLKKDMEELKEAPLPGADKELEARNTFPGYRILLAEDVEINREIVFSLLEPMELEIDAAENGKEALRLYSENPERYDMIFMDLQMPEMDGLEAARRIRAIEKGGRRVPVIAMTANVFKEDVEKCWEAGMDDHMGKPLDLNTLLEKLRKYLPENGRPASSLCR